MLMTPFNGSSSEFSNCLTSRKQKSFTDNDRRKNDGLTSKIHSYFSGRNIVDEDENRDKDKWDDKSTKYLSALTIYICICHHQLDLVSKMSDFLMRQNMMWHGKVASEQSMRILLLIISCMKTTGSQKVFLKAPGCNREELSSKFHVASSRFCFVSDDARDDLSLKSKESCSSSEVRGQGTDNSLINSKSRMIFYQEMLHMAQSQTHHVTLIPFSGKNWRQNKFLSLRKDIGKMISIQTPLLSRKILG